MTPPASEARPDMGEVLKRAVATYAAMSPVEKAMHDADQRRSFVRGQCGHDPGEDVLTTEVRRLRAANERMREALDQAYREGFQDAERALDVRHVDYVRGNVIAALGDVGKIEAAERLAPTSTSRDGETGA